MFKRFAVVVIVALIGIVAVAADKVATKGKAPRKPVEITAIVANIADSRKPLSVAVITTVSKVEIIQHIEIQGNSYSDVAMKDAKALGDAFVKMAETMTFGDKVEIAGYEISVFKSDDGKKSIYFRKTNSFSSGQFFEPDTATQLGEALLDSESVAVWANERAIAFQK